MDYSQSVVEAHRSEMQDAVMDFIDAMNDGDYAAVVKFNFDNPLGASVVAPFTEIDTVAGNQALIDAVRVRTTRATARTCWMPSRSP